WERPHWAGEHPIRWRLGELPDPLVLPFDPPGFADTANYEWLGFRYFPTTSAAPEQSSERDTETAPPTVTPGDIRVCGFRLHPKDEGARHDPRPPRTRVDHERKGLLSWLRGHDAAVPAEK